jgi:predicted ATPase with chaperone activity
LQSWATRGGPLSDSTKKVIVNLAPANLRKEGPAFDLPIALGILAASGALPGRVMIV